VAAPLAGLEAQDQQNLEISEEETTLPEFVTVHNCVRVLPPSFRFLGDDLFGCSGMLMTCKYARIFALLMPITERLCYPIPYFWRQ